MRLTLAIATALFALLPALAVLQHRWLSDLCRAELAEMRVSLEGKAEAVARECDRELSELYIGIQSSFAEEGGLDLAARLAHGFSAWANSSRHPGLIRAPYFIEASESDLHLYLYDRRLLTFFPVQWPKALQGTRTALESGEPAAAMAGAFLIPLLPQPRLAFGGGGLPQHWALAVIDPDIFRTEFIPSVLKQTFGKPETLASYYVEVRDAEDNLVYTSPAPAPLSHGPAGEQPPDTSIGLFRLGSGVLPQAARAPVPFRGAHRTLGGVGVVLSGDPRKRDSAGGAFTMAVHHRAGSLDAAAAQIRRRNLVIAFAVEAVLAASIVLFVLSIRKVQAAAECQMAFVAGLSHDMRTPLAVIQNLAQNQARGLVKDSAQVERYGTAMMQHAARLTDSIESALGFGRMRAGRMLQRKESFDVRLALKSAVDATVAIYPDSLREIRIVSDPNLPPIHGDSSAMTRVFQNLLANALKYSDRGAAITVSARRTPSNVEVAIEDRGWGIPPRDRRRIFRPFFRARAAAESSVAGTGLGLTIVKAIVEQHGGTVECASEPGHGSTFTVRIPAMREDAIQTKA